MPQWNGLSGTLKAIGVHHEACATHWHIHPLIRQLLGRLISIDRRCRHPLAATAGFISHAGTVRKLMSEVTPVFHLCNGNGRQLRLEELRLKTDSCIARPRVVQYIARE